MIHKEQIEGVFGISKAGSPWFLCTDKFDEFRISFAKESKHFVQDLLEEYGFLANFVDSRHEASIRWLKWLGFTVRDDFELLLNDPEVPFYYFVMVKEGES